MNDDQNNGRKPTVNLICADSIPPKSINWIWEGYLAHGKFHILAGAPGTGKTTIALEIAAIISRGGRFPDGSQAKVGKVLIWSGEDVASDVLVPRLMAANANLSNIHFIDSVSEESKKRSFDPASDLTRLEEMASELAGVSLVIIDSVASVAKRDSFKNAETRRSLQPVVDMAEQLNCAILGITHFTKNTSGNNPVDRVTGSLAFGALARVVMMTAKGEPLPDAEPPHIVIVGKSNLERDGFGFQYHIEPVNVSNPTGQKIATSQIRWGKYVQGSAKKLLAELEAPEDGLPLSALKEAASAIQEELKAGPLMATDLNDRLLKRGISPAAINRAKPKIAQKRKLKHGWEWSLRDKGSNREADVR